MTAPVLLALALAAASAAKPAPHAPKVFGDWIVACDNGRACGAAALIPRDAQEGWVVLELDRKAQGAAQPELEIVEAPKAATGLIAHGRWGRLTVDADGLATIPGVQTASVIEALRTTPELTLVDDARKVVARVSAKGASAALLYMDDQQGRVGTTSALGSHGPRSPSALPAPPALPVIVAAAPSAKPPQRLSPAAVKKLQGDTTCGQAPPPPTFARLDATHSLALVTDICSSGAYNMDTAVMIVTDGRPNDARAADLEEAAGAKAEDADLDDNAEWDAKTHVLSTGFLGRGIGDCRTDREYVWDGARFRLSAQAEMDECRGDMDPIPTWSTVVRRR